MLFHTDNMRCVSRHHNMIGFGMDLTLLLKALNSAVAPVPDSVDVKLTQKAVQLVGGEGGETENKPFLCFTSRVCALL